MPQLYLRLLDRVLTPVLLLLALFFFLRGHNLPGGGFIAGLIAATAFQLQILSRGERAVRRQLGPYIQPGIGIGLFLAVTAGLIGILGGNFMKGTWLFFHLGPLGEIEIGSPVLFDLGVLLVVVNVATSYLLGLARIAEGSQTS